MSEKYDDDKIMEEDFNYFKATMLLNFLNEELLKYIKASSGFDFSLDDIYTGFNAMNIEKDIQTILKDIVDFPKQCMIAVGLRKRSSASRSKSHVSYVESPQRPPVPPSLGKRESSVSSRHPNLFSRQASMLSSHPQQSQSPPRPPPRKRKVYVFGGSLTRNEKIQVLLRLLGNGLNNFFESFKNVGKRNSWVNFVDTKYHPYIRHAMYENGNSNDALDSIFKYIAKWFNFNHRSYNQQSNGMVKVWGTLWTMYREATLCSGNDRKQMRTYAKAKINTQRTQRNQWNPFDYQNWGGAKIENKVKKASKKRSVK